MDFVGGIDGMNFTPISNYNGYLKNSMALDVNPNESFETILNQRTMAMQNPDQIQGGVEMNSFDNILAQTAVQPADSSSPSGNFMDSVSRSINGGLNSVNQKIDSANKAQEAFAMGEDVSVHDVMIASEKATLSFQMATQLRNKLLTAYNEINNVRV